MGRTHIPCFLAFNNAGRFGPVDEGLPLLLQRPEFLWHEHKLDKVVDFLFRIGLYEVALQLFQQEGKPSLTFLDEAHVQILEQLLDIEFI